MSVNGVNNYSGYKATASTKPAAKGKTQEAKTEGKATVEDGAVYEKSSSEKKATYTINKMSEEERAAIVRQMKQDQIDRQSKLTELVSQMLSKQGGVVKIADLFRGDNLKNFTPEEIAKAKEDVAEDGYWGVKQTSQRMFDFASALAGDDVEKMKEMEAAMEKGFKKAGAAWGEDLPELCQETMKAARQLFQDYYDSKK